MEPAGSKNRIDPVGRLESAHAQVTAAQRRLLEAVVDCDREELWLADGARNFAQWLSTRLGISNWAARRWINAAHTLPHLPSLTAAFEAGTLCFDKVLELCRFATADTEKKLITWARRVTVGCIREKADVAVSSTREEAVELDRTRYLHYWWTDDRKLLALQGLLPADQGAVVAKAIDRLAGRLPDIIETDDIGSPGDSLDVRRADALVAMASRAIADDQDADRATIVVHAELDALALDAHNCLIEGGPVITAETARRLACDARLQVVLHDKDGKIVGVGQTTRTAPRWLQRLIRHRDRECTFPGCEARWFLHAHHIKHWIEGGPTDLDNLVLVCTWHHKLVHEYGWKVELETPDVVNWFRPDGSLFEPLLSGRAPPQSQLISVA
jgi:hypothetical protein